MVLMTIINNGYHTIVVIRNPKLSLPSRAAESGRVAINREFARVRADLSGVGYIKTSVGANETSWSVARSILDNVLTLLGVNPRVRDA